MARKRKKQVNTGLVAGITVFGMILTVVGVAVVTSMNTQRTPEFFEKIAKQDEAAGDVEQAYAAYMQAFRVSGNDSRYAIEANRVLFEAGEIQEALGSYRTRINELPRDVPLITAYLDLLWDLNRFAPNATWPLMRDPAERLLAVEPDNALGLVSLASALQNLPTTDADAEAEADAAFEAAFSADPNNPRLVLLDVNRRFAELGAEGIDGMQIDAVGALQAESIDRFRAVLAEHPGSAAIRRQLINILGNQRLFWPNAEFSELRRSDELLDEINAAIEFDPTDSDFRVALALFHIAESELQENEEARLASFAAAEDALKTAVEIEPAHFGAYELLSRIPPSRLTDDATAEERAEAAMAAVKILHDARSATLGLESARAVLLAGARRGLMISAFDRAATLARTTEYREEALQYATDFAETLAGEYQQDAFSLRVQAELAQLNNDISSAVRNWEQVAELVANQDVTAAPLALRANAALARLLLLQNQLDAALKYADEAIRIASAPVPFNDPVRASGPLVIRANALLALGRYQEALDHAEEVAPLFENDLLRARDIATVQARALRELGRFEEAEAVALAVGGDESDPASYLLRASVAMEQEDEAGAAAVLREGLERLPDDIQLMTQYLQLMLSLERSDEVDAFVTARLANETDPMMIELLRRAQAYTSASTPEEREAQIIALINETPDPEERDQKLLTHYRLSNNIEEWAIVLDRMLERTPDDVELLKQRLTTYFRSDDLDGAASLVRRLADLDADQAGGARFRGLLALESGDGEEAVRELLSYQREVSVTAQDMHQLALAYMACDPQRTSEAVAALEQAVRLNSRFAPSVRLLFALRYPQTPNLENEDALASYAPALENALEVAPNDPALQVRMAELQEFRAPDEAIADRERTREERPEDLDNLLRLASLYRKVENLNQATAVYEELQLALDQLDVADAENLNLVVRGYQAIQRHLVSIDRGQVAVERAQRFIERNQGAARVRGMLILARAHQALGDWPSTDKALIEAGDAASELSDAEERRRLSRLATSSRIDVLTQFGQREEAVSVAQSLLDSLDADEAGLRDRVERVMVDHLIVLQRFAEARDGIESFLSRDPRNAAVRLQQARLLMAERRPEEALLVLTDLENSTSGNPDTVYLRGLIYLDQRNFDQAEQDLIAAKERAPRGFNLAHRILLGQLYTLTGNFESATREYLDVLDISPGRRDAAVRLLGVYRRTGEIDKAERMLSANAVKQPEDPYWPYQLGLLQLRERKFRAAERSLRRACELVDFRNPVYLADYLTTLSRDGRFGDAIQVYTALDDDRKSPLPQIAFGLAQRGAGSVVEGDASIADAMLRAGAISTPMLQEIMRRAVQGLGVQNLSEVERICRAVIAQPGLDPINQARQRIALATILGGTDRDAEAGAELDLALAVVTDPIDRAEALMGKGRVLLRQSEQTLTDEAREVYEQILEMLPNHRESLNNLAYLLTKQHGANAEALAYAERLAQVAQENAAQWDTIGLVYMENDRLQESQSALQRAIAINPQLPEAHLHLGQLLLKRNDARNARRSLEEARSLAEATGRQEIAREARAALEQL